MIPTIEQLQGFIVTIYEREGIEGVFDYAHAVGISCQPCAACQTETPHVDGACGCCGMDL